MANESELSLMGQYVDFTDTSSKNQEEAAFVVTPEQTQSKEFAILSKNIDVLISLEEFIFLYKTVLNNFIRQLQINQDSEGVTDAALMKRITKTLMPTIASMNMRLRFTRGEIPQEALAIALRAMEFWKVNPEFVDMLIEACFRDAPVRMIQDEVRKLTGNGAPSASA